MDVIRRVGIAGARLSIHVGDIVPCGFKEHHAVAGNRYGNEGIPAPQGFILEPALIVGLDPTPRSRRAIRNRHRAALSGALPFPGDDFGLDGIRVNRRAAGPPATPHGQALMQRGVFRAASETRPQHQHGGNKQLSRTPPEGPNPIAFHICLKLSEPCDLSARNRGIMDYGTDKVKDKVAAGACASPW